MANYKVTIHEEAKKDIRLANAYYNKISPSLKRIFLDDLYDSIDSIKINPFFQIRYNSIHCLPLKKFPFMLHFTINEPDLNVTIWGLVSTYLNPADTWVYEEE